MNIVFLYKHNLWTEELLSANLQVMINAGLEMMVPSEETVVQHFPTILREGVIWVTVVVAGVTYARTLNATQTMVNNFIVRSQ